MPYLQPNSPGFLTTDEILRRAQMSRAGTEYLQQLSQATTAARDEALRQARQRDSDMYMKQHFPQFAAPGTVVNAPFASGRRRSYGGRGHGGAYYEAPNAYTPTVVATGSPVSAAPQPSNMSVVVPGTGGFTGPRTVEQIVYDQRKAGVPAPSGGYPGYMPTSSGYMYLGPKEGFQEDRPTTGGYSFIGKSPAFEDETAYRDWLLDVGVPKEDLASYGAPSVND